MKINCPTCNQQTTYSKENKFRPFCSARCKTADIAAWADEKMKISTPITEKDSLSDEDLEAIIRAQTGEEDSSDI